MVAENILITTTVKKLDLKNAFPYKSGVRSAFTLVM